MNMKSDSPDSINDYLCDTIGAVFDCVYTAPVAGGTNCEVFASDSTGLQEKLDAGMDTLTDAGLSEMMQVLSACMQPREAGNLVLTDDKAPVELLGMQVLDEIIADELDNYRDLYLGDFFP